MLIRRPMARPFRPRQWRGAGWRSRPRVGRGCRHLRHRPGHADECSQGELRHHLRRRRLQHRQARRHRHGEFRPGQDLRRCRSVVLWLHLLRSRHGCRLCRCARPRRRRGRRHLRDRSGFADQRRQCELRHQLRQQRFHHRQARHHGHCDRRPGQDLRQCRSVILRLHLFGPRHWRGPCRLPRPRFGRGCRHLRHRPGHADQRGQFELRHQLCRHRLQHRQAGCHGHGDRWPGQDLRRCRSVILWLHLFGSRQRASLVGSLDRDFGRGCRYLRHRPGHADQCRQCELRYHLRRHGLQHRQAGRHGHGDMPGRARPTAMPTRHPTATPIRTSARASPWSALSTALRARMSVLTPSARAR